MRCGPLWLLILPLAWERWTTGSWLPDLLARNGPLCGWERESQQAVRLLPGQGRVMWSVLCSACVCWCGCTTEEGDGLTVSVDQRVFGSQGQGDGFVYVSRPHIAVSNGAISYSIVSIDELHLFAITVAQSIGDNGIAGLLHFGSAPVVGAGLKLYIARGRNPHEGAVGDPESNKFAIIVANYGAQ